MTGGIRSILFVPGTRQDRFAKAMGSGADAVVFDLEDSVEAGRKQEARARVAEYLSTPRQFEAQSFGRRVPSPGQGGPSPGPRVPSETALRLVRFNAIETADGEADLEFFSATSGCDGVLLPKVETAGIVERVARTFVQNAPSGAVPPLLLLLETPRAILRAAEIGAAAAPVAALLLGAEDLTASLAIERTIDGEELSFARSQVVLAAAAAGVDAIDAVCTDLRDTDALRRDCQRARAFGFRGKMAIHPAQIPVINEIFMPTPGEVDRATRQIDAYEVARAAGNGVTTLDGYMVERPIVERARRTLALAAKHSNR